MSRPSQVKAAKPDFVEEASTVACLLSVAFIALGTIGQAFPQAPAQPKVRAQVVQTYTAPSEYKWSAGAGRVFVSGHTRCRRDGNCHYVRAHTRSL